MPILVYQHVQLLKRKVNYLGIDKLDMYRICVICHALRVGRRGARPKKQAIVTKF